MEGTSDLDVIEAVRRFVDRDVIPVASDLEHRDEYPHQLVATMRELGLFGATIPVEHGGLGLSFESYALRGSKMFITNARHGTMLAIAAKTDLKAKPAYAGISMFAVEKNEHGPTVSRNLKKLGYKGIDTCEVLLEDLDVPAANLIGGAEGLGFKQVM